MAYVEAISFCIKQTSADGTAPLLPLDAAMVGVLREVLATAMDEEAAGGPRERGRMLGLHVRGVSVEVRLRVACIELLCAAMVYEGLKAPEHTELRNKMIAAFFRCLTVKSQHVVDVARDALAKVVSEQKLQKELLQSSLRPILLNLADYRKLSVPLLHGLARLLDLLSNFFNLTLGEKLLDAIGAGNYASYSSMCAADCTSFEPETQGHLVAGAAFHKHFFDLDAATPSSSKLPTQNIMASPHVRLLGDNAAVVSYVRITQRDGQVSTAQETRVWHRAAPSAAPLPRVRPQVSRQAAAPMSSPPCARLRPLSAP